MNCKTASDSRSNIYIGLIVECEEEETLHYVEHVTSLWYEVNQ